MRRRLSRRSDAFLPVLLLIPVLLGRAQDVLTILTAYMLMRLVTLCGAEAFRKAAAHEVTTQSMRGHAVTALIGTCLFAAASWHWGADVWMWFFSRPPDPAKWNYLCAMGLALTLSKVNYEYLYARGQGGSAELCEFLASALIVAAVLLGGAFWWMCAAGLGFLISALIAFSVGGSMFAKPRLGVFAYMAGSVVRTLLYPLPGILAATGFAYVNASHAAAGYLLGLLAFGCATTTFRRTSDESASMNLALLLSSAVCSTVATWVGGNMVLIAVLYAMGALLGMLVNAALNVRVIAAMLLVAGACVCNFLADWARWLAIGLTILTAVALIPDMRGVNLHRRAMRIRKKNARS